MTKPAPKPIPKPKLKTQYYKSGQIEEYQIGTEMEPVECSNCDGCGEITEEFEWGEETCRCDECGGSGIFYVSID